MEAVYSVMTSFYIPTIKIVKMCFLKAFLGYKDTLRVF